MSSLLRATSIEVRQHGELVEIQVGSQVMRMGYEDALKLSQWIRLRAKQAKQFAGDTKRDWSVVAAIDPLET